MACLSCGRGFHSECDNGCDACHSEDDTITKSISIIGTGKGAPVKNPEDVLDRHSTGRKRAAQLYPIYKNQPCEWRGKANCGGGLNPIIGCIDGFQRDRHHGPVKDTLRNEPGNVHRICKKCHNRWHARNDPVYDEMVYGTKPHNPEPTDELTLLANEAEWKINK